MKTNDKNLRAWEVALLVALSFTLCVGVWARNRQNAISAQVVRLHVIAVSDAAEEQQLKLRVRDAVLAYLEPELKDTADAAEAKSRIEERLEQIARAAESAAEGRSVSVTLGRESYPTRNYQGFSLPAGSYESLRVVLGEGKGHNWWCVVFPPLCLSAADAERVQSVMNTEDFKLVSEAEGYELRFRVVELWGELLRAIDGK